MSIYKSRIGPRFNEDDVTVTRTVTNWDAPKPPWRVPAPKAEPKDWSGQRKSHPIDHLLPLTRKWVESLPADITPMALIDQYPRITNLLALECRKLATCGAFFDELLIDRRGDREGFPPDVHRDLQRLRAYYAALLEAQGHATI